MRLSTSKNNLSNIDRGLGIALAAFSTFVLGYTVTRAFLSQPYSSNLPTVNEDLVLPHQATLWQDFSY